MLRHVGERHATIWVEVDTPAEVEVLGHTAGKGLPPSVIRPLPPRSSPTRLRLAFGSCRLALPHGPAPGRAQAGLSRRSRRIAGRADALRALALRVAAAPRERW